MSRLNTAQLELLNSKIVNIASQLGIVGRPAAGKKSGVARADSDLDAYMTISRLLRSQSRRDQYDQMRCD